MRFLLAIVLLWSAADVRAQTELNWADLSKGISWVLMSPEDIFGGFKRATFSPEMKALEGEQVILTGYFLVLEGTQSVYLLSKNPMASCFFCGNGGPETVVDLQFTRKPSFVMDDILSVKGILQLNGNDPNSCYYKIANADAISLK